MLVSLDFVFGLAVLRKRNENLDLLIWKICGERFKGRFICFRVKIDFSACYNLKNTKMIIAVTYEGLLTFQCGPIIVCSFFKPARNERCLLNHALRRCGLKS